MAVGELPKQKHTRPAGAKVHGVPTRTAKVRVFAEVAACLEHAMQQVLPRRIHLPEATISGTPAAGKRGGRLTGLEE